MSNDFNSHSGREGGTKLHPRTIIRSLSRCAVALLLLLVAACTPQAPDLAPAVNVPSPTITLTRTPAPTRTPTPQPTLTRTPRPSLTPLPTAGQTAASGRPTPTSYAGAAAQPTTGRPTTAQTQVSDARQALAAAAAAMDELESLHTEYTLYLILTAPNDVEQTQVGSADAVRNSSGQSDFEIDEERTITTSSGRTDIVEVGYIKTEGDRWEQTTDGDWVAANFDAANFDAYHFDAFVLREVAAAEWLPDDAVGGALAHLIAYTVDIANLDDLPPLGGRRAELIPAERQNVTGSVEGKTWIDPQTSYVLQQTLSIELQFTHQEHDFDLLLIYEVTAGQFDEAPDIEPPTN